jgi:hypothetical protein
MDDLPILLSSRFATPAVTKSAKIQTRNDIHPKKYRTVKSNRSATAMAPIALFWLRIFPGLKDAFAGILNTRISNINGL